MVVNLQSCKETYLKLRIIGGTEQGDELPSLHYMINCVAVFIACISSLLSLASGPS